MNQPTVFQIKLKSVNVIENGAIENNIEGVNALEASLFYPKEGGPSISSIRPLRLKDKELLDGYLDSGFRRQDGYSGH